MFIVLAVVLFDWSEFQMKFLGNLTIDTILGEVYVLTIKFQKLDIYSYVYSYKRVEGEQKLTA